VLIGAGSSRPKDRWPAIGLMPKELEELEEVEDVSGVASIAVAPFWCAGAFRPGSGIGRTLSVGNGCPWVAALLIVTTIAGVELDGFPSTSGGVVVTTGRRVVTTGRGVEWRIETGVPTTVLRVIGSAGTVKLSKRVTWGTTGSITGGTTFAAVDPWTALETTGDEMSEPA